MRPGSGRWAWRVVACSILSGLTCCSGGGELTAPEDLGTFDGEYVLRIGSDTVRMRGKDYRYKDHREVILHNADGTSLRVDFKYAEEGRAADEVRELSILFFPGQLASAPGAPLPRVVVRAGRNEIDDGVLEGLVGFPEEPVANLHWSLRVQ